MSELNFAIEAIHLSLKTLGLIALPVACCYGNLNRDGVLKYFDGLGKDYYDVTNQGLLGLVKEKLMVHDHPVGGAIPDMKKRQLVVSIPKGNKGIDQFVANPDQVEIIDELVKEGNKIPETDLIHDHNGKGLEGPWEYQTTS